MAHRLLRTMRKRNVNRAESHAHDDDGVLDESIAGTKMQKGKSVLAGAPCPRMQRCEMLYIGMNSDH